MENSKMQDSSSADQNASGPPEGKGYETPGRDMIIESTSDAIQSPTRTSSERLQTPKPVIETIGQTPGNANPAIAETAGFEHGEMSTADLLRAREDAEEQFARNPNHPQQYQDQGSAASTQEARDQAAGEMNTGRPTPASLIPNDQQQAPTDYVGSPHAGEPLMKTTPEVFGMDSIGRQEATMERERAQASQAEYGSGGLPSVGWDAEADAYARREMHTPSEPSDLDSIAPRMTNLPPEENSGEQ